MTKALLYFVLMIVCLPSMAADEVHISFSTDVTSLEMAKSYDQWHSYSLQNTNFGHSVNRAWVKVEIPKGKTLAHVVSFNNPFLEEVTAYQFLDNKLQAEFELGANRPSDTRQFDDEALSFYVQGSQTATSTIYIDVRTSNGLRLPLRVMPMKEYYEYKSRFNTLFGTGLGAAFALVLTTTLLFFLSRKIQFITATLYLLGLQTLGLYLYGFGYRYFELDNSLIQQVIVPFLFVFTPLLLFWLSFQLKRIYLPRAVRVWTLVIATSVCLSPLYLSQALADAVITSTALCVATANLLYVLWVTYHRPVVRNFALIIATSTLMLLLAYVALAVMGAPVYIDKASLVVFIPAALSATSVTGICIYNLLQEHDIKLAVQQRALAKQQAKDQLLAQRLELEQQSKEELENQVEQRTIELQITLRELEDKNTALERINNEDPLTGAKNRRFFDRRLDEEIRRANRDSLPLSLLMLDIDHFKQINDRYGHPAGDAAIKLVAEQIKASLGRPFDQVCRYGGEEFAIIAPSTSLDGALMLAERIRNTIALATVEFEHLSFGLTVSLGIHTATDDTQLDAATMIQDADDALYRAKQNGRNRVEHSLSQS